jgi:RNA polymerase sigma factor (sigma-70 family)
MRAQLMMKLETWSSMATSGATSDAALLREYVATRSAESFDAIVREYSRLVYSVCFRTLGEAQAAEDASQATFLVLLKKAAALSPETVLASWLYCTAQHCAKNLRRSIACRAKYEREAGSMEATRSSQSGTWEKVQPQLDEAIALLPEVQRTSIVLHCLQGLTYEEMSKRMGCSISTARVRVARGIERLRGILQRRGAVVSSVSLATLLGQQCTLAIPAELTARISAVCAGKSMASTAALACAETAAKTALLGSAKMAIAAAVLLCAAIPTAMMLTPNASQSSVPKTFALAAPQPGSVLRGIVQLTANVDHVSGITSVEYLVNGAPLIERDRDLSPVSAAPFSIMWDSGNAANGAACITAVARDAAGRVLHTADPVSVTVENNAAARRGAGVVRIFKRTDPQFDKYTIGPDQKMSRWFAAHFWGMAVFSPYFDTRLNSVKRPWLIIDCYGINVKDEAATQHPEWVLKDAAGQPLYVPYSCSEGKCEQFAADISNAGYRRWLIEEVRADLARGYADLWINNVSMQIDTSDNSGKSRSPIDSKTKQPMRPEDWRRYLAEFTEEVRRALPQCRILHNAQWFAGPSGIRDLDPTISRQLKSADYINVAQGFNDSGLTGGDGEWSVSAMMQFVDRLHALGKHVIIEGLAEDDQSREYQLAGYFLISQDGDALSNHALTPDNWWVGYDVYLGIPIGERSVKDGVWARRFSQGLVLLAEPGAKQQTITLPGPCITIDGKTVTSIMLNERQGAVLRMPAR